MSEVGPPLLSSDETLPEVLRRAEELEVADWAGAIELLESVNRAARSDEVEIALAGLRHRSFATLSLMQSDEVPAEGGTSPPVGESGLPEASLAGLTADTVRGALLDRGCLLVRGAVDAERARHLSDAIDSAFAAQEQWVDPPSRPSDIAPGPRSAWFCPLAVDDAAAAGLGRKWVRAGGGVLLPDSPRMMFEVLDLYVELGLRSIVSEYLGSRPVLSANKGTLRRVPLDAVGGWHQDGAFLGSGFRAINLWLTLTPCGVDAPGLDLVPRRFDEIIETGTGGSYFDWAVGPEVVQRVADGVGIARPQFEAGDLVIFDDLMLHRTAIEPEMTRERHAIEMWCFAHETYPSGQVPLVW